MLRSVLRKRSRMVSQNWSYGNDKQKRKVGRSQLCASLKSGTWNATCRQNTWHAHVLTLLCLFEIWHVQIIWHTCVLWVGYKCSTKLHSIGAASDNNKLYNILKSLLSLCWVCLCTWSISPIQNGSDVSASMTNMLNVWLQSCESKYRTENIWLTRRECKYCFVYQRNNQWG